MAKTDKKQPWLKFYPSDWSGDRKLHMCSIGARGLWVEMMCVMHEAEPYGHLVTDGKPVTNRQIASLAGISLAECGRFMMELESAGVYSRDENNTIFSRRMVRDKAKAEQDRKNGKGGGNPQITETVKEGVNPPDKAQKPEARIQNQKSKTSESNSPSKAFDVIEGGVDDRPLVIDESYEPSDRAIEYAFSLGMKKADLDSELRKFIASSIATRAVSFNIDMSFKVWCDRWLEFKLRREPNWKPEPPAEPIEVEPYVLVVQGTPESAAWDHNQRSKRLRPLFYCRHLVDGIEVIGARCSTLFPPGYDEATGEKLAPANEENAA